MNFVIASLLEIFTEDEAFWIFNSLLIDKKLKGMFEDSLPLLGLYTYVIEVLIDFFLPQLSNHLKKIKLDLGLFLP